MIEPLYEAHAGDEPFNGTVSDKLTARALLIEWNRNARRCDELAETLDAVACEYKARILAIGARQQQVREMMLRFVQDHGKVSFPDVGSAFVVERKAAPRISDPAALLAWAHVHAPTLIETSEKVPAKAVTELVKSDGVLPDGVEVVTPDPSLTIKGRS